MHIHSKSLWSLIAGIVLLTFGIILMFSFSWLKITDIVIGVVISMPGFLLLSLGFVEFIAAHKVKAYNTLKSFSIRNGIVEITVKSGKVFSSSLSDLFMNYHLEENRGTGKLEISGYSLKNNKTGEKITIYYRGTNFDAEMHHET